MKRWCTGAMVVAIVMMLASPAVALAVRGSTTLVRREVTTVTGVDAADALLEHVKHVEVGATTATLTVDGAEGVSEMTVDYGDAAAAVGLGGDGGAGLLPVAALTVGLGAFGRFLKTLMRLGK